MLPFLTKEIIFMHDMKIYSISDKYISYLREKNPNVYSNKIESRTHKTKTDPKERFIIQGIEDAPKQKEDFWNTINGNKVNINLLTDDDVGIVEDGSIRLIVILCFCMTLFISISLPLKKRKLR